MEYIQQEINIHKNNLKNYITNLISTENIDEEIFINNEIKKETEIIISLLNVKRKSLNNNQMPMDMNMNFNQMEFQPNIIQYQHEIYPNQMNQMNNDNNKIINIFFFSRLE